MRTVNKGRKTPSKAIMGHIIAEQTGRCGYCNASLVDQSIEWDHFIPYSYMMTNPDNNWVASCHECNQAKGNRIFKSDEELAQFCLKMLKSHGSFADGWPDGSTTAFRNYI